MIYFILIFSFLVEGSFSNLISSHSIFIPLFFLSSLTFLYPYFNGKKLNFIIASLICGLFYDVIYTNSLFVNTLDFTLCGYLIILCYSYVNYNLISSSFINVVVLIFYRIFGYLLLCFVSYISFNFTDLCKSIYSSIISNLIYGIVLYSLINLIFKELIN